jgi:serine/threonine protein kinase
MSEGIVKFAVGGAVQAKNGTYISRAADADLLAACKNSEFAYILASRQIGKSSLMNETAARLAREGVKTARIDLNVIGKNVAKADDWHFNFIDTLAHHLDLKIEVERWWEARPRVTPTRRFLQFLRDVVLNQVVEPIVIFVDEIDMMLGLDFADDFFAAIRAVYHERAQEPAYRRLTFVLLGVAAPDDLIKDETRTPFNIGKGIILPDFTLAECEPFRRTLEKKYPDRGRAYFDQIYAWTQGHPYLTQKLCAALLKTHVADEGGVEAVVQQLFLTPEGRGDDNLQFVQSRVKDDAHAVTMLRIYKRVLQPEEQVTSDEQTLAINRLKLYGLVITQNGRLAVRNRLYAHVFDAAWTDDVLRDLRLGLPGDYTILRKIGQGDMTTVYLAQTQYADETRLVALKVIDLHQEVEEVWSNWTAWVEQVSAGLIALEHPNLIRVYEVDYNVDNKIVFIAMEYIAGETLREELKRGSLSRSEAVDLVRQIGAGLIYAHEQNKLHLGVNPDNILLDSQLKPARPVLINFGLAQLLPTDEYLPTYRTAMRLARAYMAPEQWRQPEALTPATDIYGLALVFFEALNGQLPPRRQPGEPLPRLSSLNPEFGGLFDQLLVKATAGEAAGRFERTADFIRELETINEEAEQIEQVEQRKQAGQAVSLARNYIQKNRYDPDKALSMIEVALEMYPDYLEALRLRGKIRLELDQVDEALEDYRQAYEQTKEPASDVGLEYLEALSRVAESYWQRQMQPKAVQHYETVRQVLGQRAKQSQATQKIWQQARGRLVEYHQHEGEMAYAAESPENIDEAISVLGREIAVLETLEAHRESWALQNKLKQLRVKKYQHRIELAQEALGKMGTQTRLENEADFFQHHLALDEAYQNLIELEPNQKKWQENRDKNLKEWVEGRRLFAIRAMNKLDPDYEAALRHYKAILEIEQSRAPGIAQELDLATQMAELERKVDHDGKYRDIQSLAQNGEYLKALERLDKDFIFERNYEHREVARWLWGLVHAKRHNGKFPPEWESLPGFESLSKRLAHLEKERIQRLKVRLAPWSQDKILETIEQGIKRLGELEESVNSVEALLDEAIHQGVTRKNEVEHCRGDLTGVKAHIQKQRSLFLQIRVNDIAQKIEAWLQKIEDIEELLDKPDSAIKDIPQFFNQSDEVQQTIEEDAMFGLTQNLAAATAEISQAIIQIKLRIKERLVRILIDDIGHRDEALAGLRQEIAAAQSEVAQIQAQSAVELEEATALRQKITVQEGQIKRLNRQYEINHYAIPLALLAAVLAGGLAASRIHEPGDLVVIGWIGLVLLVVYFFYYVWVYYISKS